MDEIWVILCALALGMAALIFGKRTKEDAVWKEVLDRRIGDTARTTIQETLDSDVEAIQDDVEGDDPAGDLADRGNARDRRRK